MQQTKSVSWVISCCSRPAPPNRNSQSTGAFDASLTVVPLYLRTPLLSGDISDLCVRMYGRWRHTVGLFEAGATVFGNIRSVRARRSPRAGQSDARRRNLEPRLRLRGILNARAAALLLQ